MSAAHDKIAKLLNMTVANGCTEDEQETALRMAAGIAAREGIDMDACRPKDQPKPKAKSKHFSQQWKPHQALAAQAAGELYGVECNVWNLGAGGIMFVGREELIELAEQTMFWLMGQVETMYKQALPKGLDQRDRAEFRKTFKAACALRTWQRSVALMRQMRQDQATAQAATGQNALVVQGYFTQLKEEQNAFWNEKYELTPEQQARIDAANQREEDRRNALTPAERAKEDKKKAAEQAREERKAAKRKGRPGRQIPIGSGTNLGYEAGDRIQLRREIEQ
jgi:uncharacterized protein DUF2786